MLKDVSEVRQREIAMADAVREVASELRLIEPVDLVAYIRAERFANIDQLVNSSTELFYKPGKILFARSADVVMKWGEAPIVVLDMEFSHRQIQVYFKLKLEDSQAGVEIDYIKFGQPSADPSENTRSLIRAIADARLGPVTSRIAFGYASARANQ